MALPDRWFRPKAKPVKKTTAIKKPTKNPDAWRSPNTFLPTPVLPRGQSTLEQFFPGLQPPQSIAAPTATAEIERRAREARMRQNAQVFAERYGTGRLNTLDRGHSTDIQIRDARTDVAKNVPQFSAGMYAKRDGLDPEEVARRIRQAGKVTSALKGQYRSQGLYFGDRSKEYDPLLKNAAEVETTAYKFGTQGEEFGSAARRYTDQAQRLTSLSTADVQKRVSQAAADITGNSPRGKAIQGLLAKAEVIAKMGGHSESVGMLRSLVRMANDPASIENPQAFLAAYEQFTALAFQEDNRDNSFLGQAKRAGAEGLGSLVSAAGYLQEQLIMQPYYAGTRARDQKAGVGGQIRAMAANLPGLGFTGDRTARRTAEEVNSYEERQALRDKGNLRSFGENVFGDTKVAGKRLSGAGDLAFTLVSDPLNAVAGAAGAFSQIGRYSGEAGARAAAREIGVGLLRRNFSDLEGLIEATAESAVKNLPDGPLKEAVRQGVIDATVKRAQTARAAYLANTATGKRIMEAAEEVALKGIDASEVRRMVPGLSQESALAIAAAESKEAAVDALRKAFTSGEWDPTVSLRRQMLASATGKSITGASGIGLGGRVMRPAEGLFDWVGKSRRLVKPMAERAATGISGSTRALTYNALRAGLAQAGLRIEDAYQQIAGQVVGLNVEDRLGRAWGQIEGKEGLEALFEEGLRVAEKSALRALGIDLKTATAADVARVAASEEMESWLKQMEVIAHLAAGNGGDAAAQQVLRESTYGIKRKFQSDQRTFNQAFKNQAVVPGIGTPAVASATKKDAAGLRYIQSRIYNAANQGLLSSEATDALVREAHRIWGLKSNKVKGFEQRLEAMLADRNLSDEFDRLLRNRSTLTGAVEEGLDPVGLGRRLTNMPFKLVNSFLEPVAPSKVSFLGYGNDAYAIQARVEGLDRWARDLPGLDDFSRTMLRQSAERVASEDDLFKLVHDTLRTVGRRAGMDDANIAELRKLMEGDIAEIKAGRKKVTDAILEDGVLKMSDEVQTLAQRGEVIFLPDPEDVKRTIRQWKAAHEGLFTHPLQKGRVGLARVADASILGLKGMASGNDLTARYIFESIHRKWKYLTVVPGMELATLGAGVGFAATDGDIKDKLKGAAQGASIGLVSPLRYITRVTGIEEGLRKYLSEGFNVEAFKPHLSRFATQKGLDRPFTLHNAVKAGDPIGMQYHRLLDTMEREWTALVGDGIKNPIAKLGRKEARYLDAYGRIINYQIHPETDAVAEMFLRRQAGEISDHELTQMFAAFADTEAGDLWLRRLKGAYGGPKSFDEAFARYSDFIGRMLPDETVARARLDMARDFAQTGAKKDVPKALLKDAAKRNALPEVIHAEKTFIIPKNFKQVAEFRSKITSKFAFEGPTTAFNRVPMAKSIYRDEYERLIANGVEGARAQSIAEQVAVNRTNKVMFRIDDESRFAAKADYVFPFQQPREELLRVWAPLIARNPARALHVTNVVAKAFNNGQESGLFHQDQYGNWRMAVPGSAWLSQKLFGYSQGFDFSIKDLVFFGQGAYGVSIIPSPGGPYFGAVSRLLLNRNPGWYEGLSDYQKEWFFPYGSNGRLFRPEVSRLWQAWMGEPAPFEFASRQEQRDALEKHRIEVDLNLRFQHALATAKVKGDWTTGDLDWEPSDEELDQAVSASMKAWAFVGSFFPAGPQKVRPDQKAFDMLREGYVGVDGSFDYFKFQSDYPGLDPWLVGMTKQDDKGTFESWAREYQKTDKMLRYRSGKSHAEWDAEVKARQRESAAYRERNDLRLYPLDMRQEMYDAWDQKYPDLAQQRVDNYDRDMDLMEIEGTLIGQAKEQALNQWRQRYNVSYGTYKALAARLRNGQLRTEFDPWETARMTDTIVADVEKRLRQQDYGVGNSMGQFDARYAAEQRIVQTLPVAEQIKYWQHKVNNMDYDWSDDPQLLLDRYYAVKGNLSALWKTAPMTLDRAMKKNTDSPWAQEIAKKGDDYRETISYSYAEARRLDAEMDKLAKKKQWPEYYALKKRRNALYDAATQAKNDWYKADFDKEGFLDDLKAVMVFASRGDIKAVSRITKWRAENGWFVPSDEQSAYLNMNDDMKSAYIDKLVNGLSIKSEPGQFKEGKLFWEWLTEFQQDLLDKNLPDWKTKDWKFESPADSTGKRSKGGYYRSYGYGGGRGRGSIAQDELSYAYAMFKQYNKRGGAAAPPAYKEYLSLPNDAALRSAFLRQHPEVAEYVKLGPMANMPPALAMIVADIMIRNGKWEGEARSMEEITEIAFAREMMERWNRRGDRQAPEALQAWLQMPTGVEKSQYLQAHPEIGEWLQLGPMANMPEMYREVVRDIMFRYGMWSDNQDPLGQTIKGYYSTPSYARDKYLEDHPELTEYWKLTRSPEQAAQYDLADRYFSIPDANAKRAFMAMHPELGEWFLNQRQKRYEKFLNQVAIYMGSNPELFEKYLQRQEDILSDILHKFSDMPIMRERFLMQDSEKSQRARSRTSA